MKKYIIIMLTLIVPYIFTACQNTSTANSIILPDREEIISISVSDGNQLAFSPNTEEAGPFIDEFYSILMDMETTRKASVNDTPKSEDYISIHLNCENTTSTIFYYKKNNTEYIEQPYQGIYKPVPALGVIITELLETADDTIATITFTATVLEADDNIILIKPAEGTLELDAADRIEIANEENLELQAGDIVEVEYNGEIMESYPAQLGEVYHITLVEQETSDMAWDRIPMVMIDERLYYDTGRESTIIGRCGNMDGEITSTVDATEIPTENNQSNFGSGFGYQYGMENNIEIYINDKWIVFEYRDSTDDQTVEFPIKDCQSEKYTQAEIKDAVSVIMEEFNTWTGCKMHTISYAGDNRLDAALDYCNEISDNAPYDEAIIFLTDFHSPKEDIGAWNPDEEYIDWQWFLARKSGEEWKLIQWGY